MAKKISELNPIIGSALADDDQFVVVDKLGNETKRIDKSEVASSIGYIGGIQDKSADYTAVASDRTTLIRSTATLTLSLTAAATLGDSWFVDVLASSGITTIDPDDAETIDGASTLDIAEGKSVRISCNGVAFYSQFFSADVAGTMSNVVEDTTPQAGGDFSMNGHQLSLSQGADVATASELLLLTDGNIVNLTGTTTVVSIETTADTIPVGTIILCKSVGAFTLTHHATNLILLGGANITTAAGDWFELQKYAAGDWRMVSFNGISSTADWEAGTSTKPSLASPAKNAAAIAALGFNGGNSFFSSAQTITTAGSLTLAHGLGAVPRQTAYYLECTTAEYNYSIGDVLVVAAGYRDGNAGVHGFSLVLDATNLNIRFANDGLVFASVDKNTGDGVFLTNTKWKLRVRAWA